MKKITIIMLFLLGILVFEYYRSELIKADVKQDPSAQDASGKKIEETKSQGTPKIAHQYPGFYKGIYLTIETGRNYEKLQRFVEASKASFINTMVLDVQSGKSKKCMVPAENVQLILQNGIHPVARVVMFPDGLKDFPVTQAYINERLAIAAEACENGFKEIQFDYIRFNDSSRLKHLSLKERYEFIEGFLKKAGEVLSKYNVKIAADVFGRIPLNKEDLIGQRMEGLDKVVNIICPMAYPSHYTWSKKLQNDPYYTVFITSKNALQRTKHAEIVTYIQAFKMKLGPNSFTDYIAAQIKAVHDAGVKGFILWNARQEYSIPLSVVKNYYTNKSDKISKSSDKAAENAE